jgi:glutamate---cysteine ligase / carboxylate-amine ligase
MHHWNCRPATSPSAGDHGRVRTVGVEEELLVVDGAGLPVAKGPEALDVAAQRGEGEDVRTHDLADRGLVDDDPAPGHLVPELKEQQVELGTRVCIGLAELDRELRFWRSRAESAARAVGAHVAALATSPVAVEPAATEGDRYRRMLEQFGRTADGALTCGCHVHVSVADHEEGVAVLNRLRIWLPVLTALTANSPFWQGEDTDYASYRSQVWLRWPSAGPNEPFADAAAYHRLVDDLLATGTVLDPGMLYFDARLSATWPTVEVRTADVALRVEDAVLLAGLVRGLVETAAREASDGRPAPDVRTELLRVATWRAARSGLAGDLVHPLTGKPAPAVDVLAALTEHVRPALADTGDERLVDDGVRALLTRGTGADLQRRIHAETEDLTAVVRAAVAITTGDADRAAHRSTD